MAETHRGYDANVVIVSQVVRDVKVGGGSKRARLSKDTARLRTGLRDKGYIPGDKVNCEFRPIGMTDDGALIVEIYGGMLRGSDSDNSLDPHFHHPFHLDLKDPLTLDRIAGMTLEDLLVQHCNDVTVDDGGNAQNMAVNMSLVAAAASLRRRIKFTIFSSSDPLKRLPDRIRDRIGPHMQYHRVPGVPDRIAVHLPWEYENGAKKGTFGLTTEPADITEQLEQMLLESKDLVVATKSADCFITSDASFQTLRNHGQPARYAVIVNAATKWRSRIAALAYGTDMVLPMNHKEAADVVHVIKHVGQEEEMHAVKRVPFPPPLKTNGNEINEQALKELDALLVQVTHYNHPHHRGNGLVAFNYPITFEEHGGLVVGTRHRRSVVAFTSIPEDAAERRLMEEFGNSDEMHIGETETMGAGDAAASMVAIFNTIDPQEFIQLNLEGRETGNTLLHQFAQTIFLSALSRIVGSFLIHTRRTYMANLNLEKMRELFETIAADSLDVARSLMSNPNGCHLSDLRRFGMKVVTWNLGSVVNPESEGLSV